LSDSRGGRGDAEVRNIVEGDAQGIVVQAGSIGELHLPPVPPPPPRPPPRLLPKAPLRFVNRDTELAMLDELIAEAQSAAGPVVAVLSGMRGVGKTATGSHWVNHMWSRFDGGTLYGDLSHRAGVDVSDVLGEFITELGADVALPATLAEREKLFRRITVSRKLLMLIDDATEAAHVNPLLPAGAGSVVIVTSNSALQELLRDGAELIEVQPLDETQSLKLLSDMAGRAGRKFADEPDATKRLIEICSGLPVALCVCAVWIQRRTRSVSELVARIADERERLKRLSGVSDRDVEGVFDFAYAELAASDALVYRRLGLHPGPEFDTRHAAVLTAAPPEDVADRLETLVDRHLLEPRPGERFGFHALIRLNALECAERDDDEPTRERALRHLAEWFYAAACGADRAIAPDRLRLASLIIDASDAPHFDSEDEAFAWFERERANLLAIVRVARDREWDDLAWSLVEALWLFYSNRKHYLDWIEAHEIAVACARRCGNAEAEGRLRATLSRAFIDRQEFDRADEELNRAEAAVRTSTNMRLRGSVREFVGVRYVKEGDYDRALEAFWSARAMFESFGGTRGMAIQDYQIGRALTQKGASTEAEEPLRRALKTMLSIDDRLFVGRILLRLGEMNWQKGELAEAETLTRRASEILTSLRMRLEEAQAHELLGAIADAGGRTEEAIAHRRAAYLIYRDMDHPRAAEFVAATEGSAD
jgi:tetratricopeptide (TPR) repeat protein